MAPICPNCQGIRIARIQRLWHEFLRAQSVRYRCRDCERTFVVDRQQRAVLLPKRTIYCWRCGGDIDRRRNRNWIDKIMRMAGLRAYSCRGCNATRYRF
jgi:hypothetical protein